MRRTRNKPSPYAPRRVVRSGSPHASVGIVERGGGGFGQDEGLSRPGDVRRGAANARWRRKRMALARQFQEAVDREIGIDQQGNRWIDLDIPGNLICRPGMQSLEAFAQILEEVSGGIIENMRRNHGGRHFDRLKMPGDILQGGSQAFDLVNGLRIGGNFTEER